MARKDDHGKSGARGGKVVRPKPRAPARQGVAKGAGGGGAKPAAKAAAPAQPPKVKFHGRVLEQEPLSRYTTWRIGGPAATRGAQHRRLSASE